VPNEDGKFRDGRPFVRSVPLVDDPRVVPAEFFCALPSRGVAWLYADGSLGFVRCGAPNRCDYCAMLTACENAVVIRLDAFDAKGIGGLSEGFPRMGITTTTANLNLGYDGLRLAQQKLWRQLRREFGEQVQYCGFLEWTTGKSERSKGRRYPHLHFLVKGLDPGMSHAIAARVSELWRKFAHAWQVECKPLYTPLAAIAYLALHHHKREQGPPPGTRNVKRLRGSRGYFNRPIADYRTEAREILKDERAVASIVELLEVPSGAAEHIVAELIAERIDEVRARVAHDRPKLVHVRERPHFDKATGEVTYEYVGVLGLVGPGGSCIPLSGLAARG
jgi:hypothetical protein